MSKRLYLIALTVLLPVWLYSQCDPTTPTFTVDLTGNPGGTWISPNIIRNGGCCGQNPRCIKFVITLDPLAAGISFTFASGAVPAGAMEYQIGCALPPTPVGQPICLSGPGPHILTFCKPGNNPNTYAITSIPAFVGGTDITINDGCQKVLNVTGLNPATVTWNSVSPGVPGQYNSYLSCTSGCTNPTVTGVPGAPSTVKYVVCGQPAAQCNFTPVCDTVSVTFHPTLGVNIQPSNPTICFGQTATTITAVGTGGTPPYTYLWNNVNPSQTINVGVGNYQVQLSDASGCPPVYNNITVTAFSVAISANAGPDQTKCIQSPIATINSSVTGASGGIWSGGSGTFTPNNTTLSNVSYSPTSAEIAAGFVNLILTTTGNGSCPAKTDTVRISYQNFLGVPAPTTTNVSCFNGSNGAATMTLTGGPTPYTYLWNTVPSYTTSSISNLPIGTYSVTITDGIGCKLTTTVNITQPPPLAVTSTVTNVSCFGTSTGSISVTPSGGTPGYTYSWTPTGQTSSSAINLPIGTYTVRVLDANGCPITTTNVVTQPALLTVAESHTNVSCFGGSNGAITTTVSGGTAPYTYSWSPGGSTAQNPTGLTAGNYSLTVTDNFNCTATLTVAITQPTLLVASTTVVNETCDYLNNGSITTSVTGGTPGYTYSWSPGGQTTASISALPAGSYTVLVTDTKSCTVQVVSTVTQPAPLTVGVTSSSVSCFGGSNGSTSASVSGGTPNYTYSWSPIGGTGATASGLPIGTYTVAVSDNNACLTTNTVLIIQPTDIVVTGTVTNVSCFGGSNGSVATTVTGGVSPYTYFWSSGQTTATSSGLIAGTYTLIVTDNNGCQKTLTYTVTQPTPLAVAFTSTNVSCFNGSDASINSLVSGGTPGYTYTWTPGGQTTQNVSGLPIGTYTLNVTDALGCPVSNTLTITQPTSLTPVATAVDETCDYLNNGSITTSVTGGTPGYTYLWSPGGQTTSSVSALASGTYSVAVTDSKGCVTVVTAIVNQPPTLVAGFNTPVNVSCFGGSNGSVGAIGSGGTPNYTYSWSPGGSTASNISGLPIGTYTVAITDAQSCLATNTVLITQPTDIVVTGTVTNVSCFGGSNGSVATTVTGGVSPYTYFWSSGQTAATSSGLIAGTYTLIVTDNNGCQKTLTYSVTEPTPLAIAFTSTNVSCFNGSNAIINSSVSGGTPGYTYIWSPGGQTTQNVSGLPIGTYTLQAYDSFSCTTSNTITITQPTSLTLVPSSTNETCNYLNNGTGSVAVSGGTAPYTYLWQGGSTTASATGFASGTYTVMVTDNLLCVAVASITITEPTPLVVTFTNQTNVSCFGGSNGSIEAIPSGGTPNYSYSWSPGGATTNAIFNITAGTYSITITDNNSCVVQNTVVITQPALPVSVSATSTSVTCNGGSNGSVTSNGAGGTAPYTYELNPGALTGQTVGSLIAGNYTTTVTDNNGCVASNTINVIEPAPIVPVPTSTNSTCGNANGMGSVTASGGNAPYTYSWTPVASTSTLVTGLLAGAYTITVTDANNCTGSAILLVNDTGGPSTSIFSTTNVSCNGGNDGTATAQVLGGVAPVTYTWSPYGGNGLVATGLVAGTYIVTASDANGCISLAMTSPDITEPPAITSDILTSNVSCFGGANGTATVSALGGTPGYTYTWLPSATTGSVITGLTAGTFSVQVTDANNCVHTNTFAITQPTAAVSIAVSSTSVSCFGGSNGTASSTASGGTSPYIYSWNPGSISGQNISNLPLGTYTINVTDIQGCTASNTISVIQPTNITLTANSLNSNCGAANGQATVTAAGGMGSYTYTWSPAGGNNSTAGGLLSNTYTVQVQDINGCPKTTTVTVGNNPGPTVSIASTTSVSCFGGSNASATASVTGGTGPFTYTWTNSSGAVVGNTVTATGLPIGMYTVNVTAANGCLASAVTPSAIIQPNPLALNVVTSNVNCFAGANGSATVTAFGGIPGYTFTWLPGLSTGSVVTGQAANTYSVRVTDFNNCQHTVAYSITQPTAAVSLAVSSTSVSCFGGNNGTASSNASGGTPGYTYTWTPGNIQAQNISNLTQGTYTVRTTDTKGCIASNTVTVIQPTNIVLSTSSANSNCGAANGQATVTANGGMSGYTYTWSPSGGNNSTASGLLANTYTVQVQDVNGCPKTTTVNVGDNPGPVVNIASTTSVSCFGGSNATATASVTGGTGPFTYTWSPIGGNGSTGVGLSAGNYTVQVTAANGCLASAVTPSAIVQPMPLALNVITSNVSCFAGANGSATVTAFGGIPGYTYTWLPGLSTGSVITGQAANTYSVRVNDFNNCTHTIAYSITQPTAALASTTSFTAVSCFGGSNGVASAQATGGTAPYTYNWQPVNTNGQVATSLSTGVYTVNITDSKGCTTSNTVQVTQPTLSLTATGNGSPTFCFGGSNGSATVTPNGGTPGYTYTWTPSGGNNPTASGLTPGNYNVLVGDLNGCQTNVGIIISQPTAVTGTLYPYNPACAVANGSISSQASGGTGPYTYLWSPGSSTNQSITGLLPGTYTLVISDFYGCPKTLTTTLVNLPGPTVSLVSTNSVTCFGGNDGSATISVSSGNPPYSISWPSSGSTSTTAASLIAGTHTANVTDSRGCPASITANIIQPTPVAISVSTITSVSCFGGSNGAITVSGSGGTPGYIYTWLPSGFGGPTLSNLSAGTYTVRAVDTHSCLAMISVVVTQPTTLVSSNGGITNPACFNSVGSATVNASGGTPPYTYTWTSTPVQNGNVATNLPAGSYTAFVNDANGCPASTGFNLTQPSQVVTSAGVNDTICLGQTGVITCSATGGSGNYYYTWQPTGVTNSGTYNVAPTSNTSYTVVAYDQIGCAGNPDTVSVIVYNLTAADVLAHAYSPLCPGQITTVYATVAGVQGPLSYSWSHPALGPGPGAFTIQPTQPTTYSVTVTNACGGSVTTSVNVDFNPPPTMAVLSDAGLVCVPTPVNFNDNSITGNVNDPITNWSWSVIPSTGVVFSSTTSENTTAVFNTPGTYSVSLTVTTANGCTNNNASGPIVINAYPYPVAAFSLNPSPPQVLNLPYDVLYCTNTSTGATTYVWNFGDGNTSTLINPNHLYEEVGEYTVELVAISDYGCTDTARAVVITDADLVFPNAFTPLEGGATSGYYDPNALDNNVFHPYHSGVIDYKLQIFNRWGELIFESFDVKQGWDGYYREKLCQVGVYVWKAYAKLNNGKVFNKSGDVTLLK